MSLLEVRFTGDNMKPGLIRSKEIAQIIETIEDMVASTVVAHHPNIDKDNIIVGLETLSNQSLGLGFAANMTDFTLPAVARITQAIAEQNFTLIPPAAIKGARVIQSFLKKHQCEAQIQAPYHKSATMTATTPIPSASYIKGETILYGEIKRVGGIVPKIQLKTINGQTIYCDVAEEELTRQLGGRIYTQVGIQGEASWDTETMKIVSFLAKQLLPYRKTSLIEAFEALHEAIGGSFDNLKDVDKFAQDVRAGVL